MAAVRLDREHRIRIPDDICRRLGLRAGDVLKVSVSEGRLILEPLRRARDPVEDMLSMVEKPIDIDVVRLVEESWDED